MTALSAGHKELISSHCKLKKIKKIYSRPPTLPWLRCLVTVFPSYQICAVGIVLNLNSTLASGSLKSK